jgi:hypothetical protein
MDVSSTLISLSKKSHKATKHPMIDAVLTFNEALAAAYATKMVWLLMAFMATTIRPGH